jgi:formamidopyrimidine-DNA glycosylase
MPEGPELLYFATVLKKKLDDGKITEIISNTNKPVIVPDDFEGKIKTIDCKGKLLWFTVSGKTHDYYMHIHYGITGWLTFEKPEKNIKFEFVIKLKNKEYHLYMEDRRRFSKVKIFKKEEHDKIINDLGIDIFSSEFTEEEFKDTIKSKNMILAALLLNQSIFSGIGNYIKNEALYLTHLRVKIKSSDLTDLQISKLYHNILFVAYSSLIEMLRDSKAEKYLNKSKRINEPKKLEIPYKYKVYAQEKTPDGKEVFKIKVAGRDSYCIKELCN